MAKTKLKAWVRYSNATGLIVPSTLILRKTRPSGEGWVRIPESLCCSDITICPVTP